jgi:hypothetical protein
MNPSKLPIQSVPVERTSAGTSVSNQNGVDPSLFGFPIPGLDDILKILRP